MSDVIKLFPHQPKQPPDIVERLIHEDRLKRDLAYRAGFFSQLAASAIERLGEAATDDDRRALWWIKNNT